MKTCSQFLKNHFREYVSLLGTPLAVKVLFFNIFYLEDIFSENMYAINNVIIMSKYTLRCTKLHNFLNFLGGAYPQTALASGMSYNTSHFIKITLPPCLNMHLRPCLLDMYHRIGHTDL